MLTAALLTAWHWYWRDSSEFLADWQRQDTSTRETLDRYTLQLASMQAAADEADRQHQTRQAEVAEAQKTKADGLAELDKLSRENADLLEALEGLREEFRRTHSENQEKVGQIVSPSASKPRTSAALMLR